MWITTLKAKAKGAMAKSAPLGRMARFHRDEAGTLVIFALMLAVLMLMMGGIAVDVMRYESRRTSLQNTLDRSTLAAASLTQDLDPRSVVDDYFLKAGLMDFLTSVTVTEGLNYRQVTATASADTQPLFLGMMGINDFDAPGISSAEQRVNNVEVMMVLDVSGSMNSNSRLANLKTAATQFVSTVLTNDSEHKISIGMVPFNGQVNLGTTLASKFNTINPSGTADVNCVDLPNTGVNSAYNSLTISQYAWATSVTPLSLSMTAYADTFDGTGTTSPNNANTWCPTGYGSNIIRVPSQSISDLQGYVNGLQAVGATSINAGLKWGLGLLDPGSRAIYTDLIAGGNMSNTLAGRPYAYDDKEAMKVIVLMTDGEHFAEERVKEAYKSGFAPIYKANGDGNYSIYHASKVNGGNICGSRPYYVPHLNQWHFRPWNGTAPTGAECYVPPASINGTTGQILPAIANTTQQTWPQVWKLRSVQYVACSYYVAPLGLGSCNSGNVNWNNQINLMKEMTATTDMDTQLQTICTAAKAQNVIIYGIAFEASTNGQTQIRNCSTDGATGSHYFNATGLQISTAFNAIANNISQLRLTQ